MPVGALHLQYPIALVAAGAFLDLLFLVLGLTEERAGHRLAFPLIWAAGALFLVAASAALSSAVADLIESGLYALALRALPTRYERPDAALAPILFWLFAAEVVAAGFFYPLGAWLASRLAGPAPQAAEAAATPAPAGRRARAVWRGPGVALGEDGRLYVLVRRARRRG